MVIRTVNVINRFGDVIGGLGTSCLGCSPLNAIVMRQTIASNESKAVSLAIKNVSTGCVPHMQTQVSLNTEQQSDRAIDGKTAGLQVRQIRPLSAEAVPTNPINNLYSWNQCVKCLHD